MVPIVGKRVHDALTWAGISRREVARRLSVQPARLDLIARGRVRRCHKSVRDGLARLIGEPVTSEYLGGAPLPLPARRWPPSESHGAVMPEMLHPVITELTDPGDVPAYELTAWSLARDLANAASDDRTLGQVVKPALRARLEVPVDLHNVTRYMLDMCVWREFVFEKQKWGGSVHEVRHDAEEFAYHLAAALRALLRPWFQREVWIRPHMLQHAAAGMNWVANEILLVRFAMDRGRHGDVAVLDRAGGNRALRERLQAWCDARRAAGEDELEIARRIRFWSSPEPEVDEATDDLND